MALFTHDQCLYGDDEGFGYWHDEHWLEHIQFIQIGLGTTPPVFVPSYNFAQWSWEPELAVRWLAAHSEVHDVLRSLTGISGTDLSVTDLRDETSWYEWMDSHAQEHALLRQALGII